MTKRKNLALDRARKQTLWVERTMRWSGLGEARVRELLVIPRTQSFRVNTLKQTSDLVPDILAHPVDWCKHGYSLDKPLGAFTDGRLVQDGHVYIQNAASWLPVLALAPKPGETILDVCAAPGGKSSHIQAITNNQSNLTCNDNSKPRLMKLRHNMDRLGAHATYTLCDATKLLRFSGLNPASFDKILLDAPCSGEGLMTLDDMKLFDSWSVAHIRRLSDLQKKILSESWKLLKPGGTLVYSTCTMAPEENESVIDYFLRKHAEAALRTLDFPLENRFPACSSWNNKPFDHDLSACMRLVPHAQTEAFFVAKLKKTCYSNYIRD